MADDLRRILAVILQSDFDLAGIADHVAVGHHIAGRIDDEPGTERDPVGLSSRHLPEFMSSRER